MIIKTIVYYKMKTILFVSFIIVVYVLFVLYVNYREGTIFRLCRKCSNSEIYIMNVPRFSNEFIEKIYDICKTNGMVLKSTRNFNTVKGIKANYFQLKKHIDIDTILTPELLQSCRKTLHTDVYFGSVSNKYKVFARVYEDADDKLTWHYDNNFTKGKRFTLVIPIYYSTCNTSEFCIKDRKNGQIKTIPVSIGEGVLYNGSDVYHSITKQTKGCKRIVLIIPLYENENKSFFGKTREVIFDITHRILMI